MREWVDSRSRTTSEYHMKSKIILLKFIFAGLLLFWLARSGRLELSILLISPSTIGLHIIGLALVALCLLLQILRWWLFLKVQRLPVSFGRAVWLGWEGFFISLSIPGMAGGVLSRAYLVAKDVAAMNRISAISTVVLDRLMGLLGLLCIGIVAFFGVWTQDGRALKLTSVWLFTAILFGTFAMIVASTWVAAIRRFMLGLLPSALRASIMKTAEGYRRNGVILLSTFLISLASALITIAAFMLSSRVVGEAVPWGQACQVVPLVFVAGTLPLAPDGIGVSETAAAFLFSKFDFAYGATIMLIYRFWLLLLRLPGGVLFIFHKAKTVS